MPVVRPADNLARLMYLAFLFTQFSFHQAKRLFYPKLRKRGNILDWICKPIDMARLCGTLCRHMAARPRRKDQAAKQL